MERGAGRAIVYGVAKSETRLKQLSTHGCMLNDHLNYHNRGSWIVVTTISIPVWYCICRALNDAFKLPSHLVGWAQEVQVLCHCVPFVFCLETVTVAVWLAGGGLLPWAPLYRGILGCKEPGRPFVSITQACAFPEGKAFEWLPVQVKYWGREELTGSCALTHTALRAEADLTRTPSLVQFPFQDLFTDVLMKAAHPKGNQPWLFIGRTDAEAEAPIL